MSMKRMIWFLGGKEVLEFPQKQNCISCCKFYYNKGLFEQCSLISKTRIVRSSLGRQVTRSQVSQTRKNANQVPQRQYKIEDDGNKTTCQISTATQNKQQVKKCIYVMFWVYVQANNQNMNLPKLIENIRFPNVRVIGFKNNEVESIEGLCRVWFPHLEELYINYNRIVRVAALRKAAIPKLSRISMNSNHIVDCQRMVMMDGKWLSWWCIEWKNSTQYCSNLSWLAKHPSQSLKKIKLNQTHLRQGNLNSCLKRKWNIELAQYWMVD